MKRQEIVHWPDYRGYLLWRAAMLNRNLCHQEKNRGAGWKNKW
jgi:hypothetical protein